MSGEFEAGLSASFHATHSLKGDFGSACDVHPHDYRVDVAVRGDALTDQGVLIDIVLLERALTAVISHWEGWCLDTRPELHGINTTVEALARYIHAHVSAQLRGRTDLVVDVKVWESPDVWGAFRARVESGP